MTAIFNRTIFNDAIFNTAPVEKIGGKGDNPRKRHYLPFKPTGLLDRPRVPFERAPVAVPAEVIAKAPPKEVIVLAKEQPVFSRTTMKDLKRGTPAHKQPNEDEAILALLMDA